MSRSGVAVDSECITIFEELKLKKNHKYIIYKLNDSKTTVVTEKTSTEGDYEDFVASLPENDCRYAVYDFSFESAEGGQRSKICFFSWSPDDAPVRAKMVYSSSKDALRRALNGIAIEVQGTDFAEVAYETVLEKARKGR